MNTAFTIFLMLYIAFMMLFVYVMICGNNKFHRNGLIGKIYRFITLTIPSFFTSLMKRICPKFCFSGQDDEDGSCTGPHGPCKYFVAFFFYIIYMVFSVTYLMKVYPNIPTIFNNHSENYIKFIKFFSLFVLPWPWVIFILFQFLDPGEIRNDNVESYLKIYPYDYQLYFPKLCPTLNIPIVPRSRYCKYTNKRIAYVF